MTDDTEAGAARPRSTTICAGTAGRTCACSNFAHAVPLDWEALIGRTRSTSYLPREGPAYEAMAAELRALYDRAAEFGGARFVLVTSVHLGERQ